MNIHDKNQSHNITLEEARTFDCCKELTDEEITLLLECIREFAEITYLIFAKKKLEEGKQQDGYDDYKLAA